MNLTRACTQRVRSRYLPSRRQKGFASTEKPEVTSILQGDASEVRGGGPASNAIAGGMPIRITGQKRYFVKATPVRDLYGNSESRRLYEIGQELDISNIDKNYVDSPFSLLTRP